MESIHKRIKLDKCDRWILKKYSFYIVGKKGEQYPATEINKKTVYLHHFILPKKKGFQVDHINRNAFDNRRSNLRYATPAQNMMNTRMRSNNTSGYRGVTWNKGVEKWHARIGAGGKIDLGYFDDIEEASKAYKKKALKLFEGFVGETE